MLSYLKRSYNPGDAIEIPRQMSTLTLDPEGTGALTSLQVEG